MIPQICSESAVYHGMLSLDGKVNKRVTMQRHRHTHLGWYSVRNVNTWSKYKSKCSALICRHLHCIQIHTHSAWRCAQKCVHLMNFAFNEFTSFSYKSSVYARVCACMIILLFHSSINILGYTLILDHCSSLVV